MNVKMVAKNKDTGTVSINVNGQVSEFDHVIVTVSLGVLKNSIGQSNPLIAIPDLTTNHSLAINRLGYPHAHRLLSCSSSRISKYTANEW